MTINQFMNKPATRTTIPTGGVPADFNSWINHISKQRLEMELKRLKGDFDWINNRNGNEHILNARVVWVDSIHEQKHERRS